MFDLIPENESEEPEFSKLVVTILIDARLTQLQTNYPELTVTQSKQFSGDPHTLPAVIVCNHEMMIWCQKILQELTAGNCAEYDEVIIQLKACEANYHEAAKLALMWLCLYIKRGESHESY